MQQAVSDPVIRYGALALVAASFLAFLAVAVHGYWVDPGYQLPPFVAAILGPILGGVMTLIGAHTGAASNSQGVTQGALVTKNGLAASALAAEGVPHD